MVNPTSSPAGRGALTSGASLWDLLAKAQGGWPLSRSRYYLGLVICGLLLIVALLGFWRQAEVATLPANIPGLSSVLPGKLEGLPVADRPDLRFLVEAFPAGQPLRLISDQGTDTLDLIPVRTHQPGYLAITLISGLFFWGMAALVFLRRYHQPAVPLFFWITLMYGVAILVGGVYGQAGLDPPRFLLSMVQVACLAYLPAVFLHLGLSFPHKWALRYGQGLLLVSLYGMAGILTLWQAWTFLDYFRAPDPAAFARLALPLRISDIFMVIQASAGIILLVVRERMLGPCVERQQVRWLLLGFLIGASPYLFFRTLPQLFAQPPPFPAYLDRIFEPAIPLAFVFAIIKYRFLDYDIILRRGILYSILAALVLLLILLPVTMATGREVSRWPLLQGWLPVLGGLLAGLLFLPLRMRLGRAIDRAFFRIRHRLDGLVRELARDLKQASSIEAVQGLAVGVLENGVHPAGIKVVIDPSHDTVTRPDPRPALDRDDALTIPLNSGAETLGLILLGPKITGNRYANSERVFVTDVAQVVAARLQEIILVQRVVEERLQKEQLNELGQLKDGFLSRVAHDLRTPVTSLSWSLRNLLDGLAGQMNDRQTEYLQVMQHSTTHLDSLVQSLLEISRLEKAEIDLSLGPTSLAEAAARSVGTVRPLADERGISFFTKVPSSLPAVLGHPDKLAEVLVNLLANAVRYSPDQGQVEMTAEREEDRVVLAVRDHGPGLSGVEDPFARFAQGKPSAHGQGGYGLGLTIAREYMHLMNGTIAAGHHPEGGALFTLVFLTAAEANQG